MDKEEHKPTKEFYSLFQFLYDFLNKELFENQLPDCMIIITRKTNTFGYFQPERWINQKKVKSDEIAINPFYFDRYPLVEILQTMAHEMCHLWQFHFGKPSKRTYHNAQWAEKMQRIGLMPSNTGKPDGKKVGQKMMEYPIRKGKFTKMANKIVKHRKFKNLWYDRVKKEKQIQQDLFAPSQTTENNEILIENTIYENLNLNSLLLEIPENADLEIIANSKGKGKYSCLNCKINIWGKKGLNIICGECQNPFSWIPPKNEVEKKLL